MGKKGHIISPDVNDVQDIRKTEIDILADFPPRAECQYVTAEDNNAFLKVELAGNRYWQVGVQVPLDMRITRKSPSLKKVDIEVAATLAGQFQKEMFSHSWLSGDPDAFKWTGFVYWEKGFGIVPLTITFACHFENRMIRQYRLETQQWVFQSNQPVAQVIRITAGAGGLVDMGNLQTLSQQQPDNNGDKLIYTANMGAPQFKPFPLKVHAIWNESAFERTVSPSPVLTLLWKGIQIHLFDGDKVQLGRHPGYDDNDIILADWMRFSSLNADFNCHLSLRHAVMEISKEETCVITNLSQSNPTAIGEHALARKGEGSRAVLSSDEQLVHMSESFCLCLHIQRCGRCMLCSQCEECNCAGNRARHIRSMMMERRDAHLNPECFVMVRDCWELDSLNDCKSLEMEAETRAVILHRNGGFFLLLPDGALVALEHDMSVPVGGELLHVKQYFKNPFVRKKNLGCLI